MTDPKKEPPSAPVLEGKGLRGRVLMLAYYFPPIRSSGTYRSVRFARNLPECGWSPTILTVAKPRVRGITLGETPAGFSVHRSRELNLNGIVSFMYGATSRLLRMFGVRLKRNYFRDFIGLPDLQIAWLCVPKAMRLMRHHDIIYVSCRPFSAALSASVVKVLARKPLVVDFRDAWTPYARDLHTALHAWVARIMERWVVRVADRLILNTEGAAQLYREIYPNDTHKIVVIPNGFDQLMLVDEAKRDCPFRIVHVGHFYQGRTPRLMLEALAEIGNPDIEFLQVGKPSPEFERYADRVNIRCLGEVDRDRALAAMQTASLLYVRQIWHADQSTHVAVAAKTYEYLATGLPILAEGPPGDNGDVVERYAKYGYVVRTNSKEAVKAAILRAYANRASFVPEVNAAFAQDYNARALTDRLADLLEEVVAEVSAESSTT